MDTHCWNHRWLVRNGCENACAPDTGSAESESVQVKRIKPKLLPSYAGVDEGGRV